MPVAAERRLPVFVYGLLRPGGAGFVELELGGRVDVLGTDRVAGTLHDLGDYPGAMLGGGGHIIGELLGLHDAALLARLDAYELFDPADPVASEYRRVAVTTVDGGVMAWIYVYNHDLAGAQRITDGLWRCRPAG